MKQYLLLELDGFCQECKKFAHLFLVAPWRYRCGECSVKEAP